MPTASPPPVVERNARTRAIERLEELLPLVTRCAEVLSGDWSSFVIDEAYENLAADGGMPRDFAALEIRACIDRFRANGANDDHLACFADAIRRLSDHSKPIGPAWVKRMINLLTDPTRACPALRWD